MYHPGCHCPRCSEESLYRTEAGIPLDAGAGLYFGVLDALDRERLAGEISFKRERGNQVSSTHRSRE